MFSKKATKIDKIFTVDLTLCSKRQIDIEDFVNFRGLLRKYELYIYCPDGSPMYFDIQPHENISSQLINHLFSLTSFLHD